ncbi:MAG TPA: DUF72 domain-containing protein [Aestuariivirga sp.]|nr:DUF72 domain-containing protein [Aestuariivirga sp.]
MKSFQEGARKVWIGTSGWTYDGWRGLFYPKEIPKRLWLPYYATQFATTEINASFYRTPTLETVQAWSENTPHNFTFAWKASKFITHWKRLSAKSENSIALMETRLDVLGPKGCLVLFQLPPSFLEDKGRLDAFIHMLPRSRRYAFEFRHRSWYHDKVVGLLEDNKIALCISDHGDAPSPWEATAPHVYIRAHGPGGRYHGSYSAKTLARWAERVAAWRRERREIFIYFDNDQKAAAPKDAQRLLRLVQD